VVAVFEVQFENLNLPKALQVRLTKLVTQEIGLDGVFQVMPPGDIQRALQAQQVESYKSCYDERCQIELGRQLSANKLLTALILKSGTRCRISASLYDLQKQTTDLVTKEVTGCGEDELVAGLESVVEPIRRFQRESQPQSRSVAAVAQPPPPSKGYVEVGVGSDFGCALQKNGRVACWGASRNYRGEDLGITSPPPGVFKSISVGGAHACGLLEDGSAHCWGANNYGKARPPAGVIFVALSAGGEHTCGIDGEGLPHCWGFDVNGQSSPPSGLRLSQVSVGGFHTCGVQTNGAAVCWGSNDSQGKPGTGQAQPPAGIFVAVSAGYTHTCGLRPEGAVVCWGNNYDGVTNPPSAERFSTLRSGSSSTCGLRLDGKAICWGWMTESLMKPPDDELFVDLAVGSDAACGIRPNGSLGCWGDQQVVAAPPAP
jgi:hypothetical protein